MSRPVRLLVIAVAWILPATWVVCALGFGASDGTTVWSSPITGGERWGSTVTVQRTFGSTPLREGDVIRTIDGRSFGDWVSGAAESGGRSVGETVPYEVRRSGTGLDLILEIEVPLTRYPLGAALADAGAVVMAVALLLLAGSLVFWQIPESLAGRAFLATAALLPAGVTSVPWGLGAIDLAGSRGIWPHAVGQAMVVLSLGLGLLVATTVRSSGRWDPRHRWLSSVVLLPAAGYVGWAGWAATVVDDGPAQRQALLTIAAPAVVVAVPAALGILGWTFARSRTPEVRLSSRLALLTLVAGLVAILVLGVLPARLGGEPLLPWPSLLLLVTPAVLAGLVTALVGRRLDEVEPVVRRALTQALVAAVIGAVFLGVAVGVGRAAGLEVRPLIAGGIVALLVLPVAIVLQRLLVGVGYGDRDLPRVVVSELRQLDPTGPPAESLKETLELLARRLRLAHARIEVSATPGADPVVAAVGEPRGRPVIVELVAGGHQIGSLTLEADLQRDPFGRADRRLLEDVGGEVGALAQAVLANRELQRSRQQLVTAREEERRRLRRELHDGLGPSLATMALRLESAQELIASDPEEAEVLVARLSDLARDEISEVRRLVDDLRPAALDQLGLVSALRQRSAQHNLTAGDSRDGTGRSGVTWSVEADEDVEPLPAAVEVAAYRIILEAVTNAIRHSGGERCDVTLRRDGAALRLSVQDDGEGLAEDLTSGVGLSSMRERAEELGGGCVTTSHPGGTRVEAWLPLPEPTPDG